MQLSSAPGLASQLRRLVFETREPIEFLDITDEVTELVRVAGLRDGVVTVFSRHTTCATSSSALPPLTLITATTTSACVPCTCTMTKAPTATPTACN